jgi:hypothetical protein
VLGQGGLEGVVVVVELAVEQAEELGEHERGVRLAGDGALGAGQQVVLEPLGQDGRVDAAAVGLPAAERGHPLLTDPRGGLRRRVVRDERQRDVPVHRGEQAHRRGW